MNQPNFEWIKKDKWYIIIIGLLLIAFLVLSYEYAAIREDAYEAICPKKILAYGTELNYTMNVVIKNESNTPNTNT